MKKILILLMALWMMVGCNQVTKEHSNQDGPCDIEVPCQEFDYRLKDVKQVYADMSAYKDFDAQQHVFVEISLERAIAVFKQKESAFLYFGFPKCPWCVDALPILNQVALDHKVEVIYYIDMRKEDNMKEELKNEIVEIMKEDLWLDKETNKPRLYVPDVAVVKDGVLVKNHVATVEGHNAKERKMNEEESKELYRIYEEMLTLK